MEVYCERVFDEERGGTLKKTKMMRVDQEFAEMSKELKEDFRQRGLDMSNRQITQLIGRKVKRNKDSLFERIL